jgi:hypothetical protein
MDWGLYGVFWAVRLEVMGSVLSTLMLKYEVQVRGMAGVVKVIEERDERIQY